MIALLTGEAFQVVDVVAGPHDHLESGNDFVAGRAEAGVAEEPQIVALAQHEIPFGVERRSHLAQSAVTAAALETVLVPEKVESSQQKSVLDVLSAAGAQLTGARLLLLI